MSELDIFEIERFAIHDGAGIRTTVFFQGCPLRCEWCANPESQTVGKHIMWSEHLCTSCGRCRNVCTENAITDRSRCVSCGSCAEVCPNSAIKISGRKITCDELFDIVMRDADYYKASGGGVTLSGGEALLQLERLIPFLNECRKKDIHIAVETCGYIPLKNVKTAMEYIDLFLFDIKTLDGEKFRKNTSGDIEKVMSAFEYIAESTSEKLVVRVPVIPDFNDDEITEIIEYAVQRNVREVHLLPYHTLGIAKYAQLGLEYPYHIRESLDPEKLLCYIEIGEKLGANVKIGG